MALQQLLDFQDSVYSIERTFGIEKFPVGLAPQKRPQQPTKYVGKL